MLGECWKKKPVLSVSFHPEGLLESNIRITMIEICHPLRYSKASEGEAHFIIDQGIFDCAGMHVHSRPRFLL